MEDALREADSVASDAGGSAADTSADPDSVLADASEDDATDPESGASALPDAASDDPDGANGDTDGVAADVEDDPFAVPDPIDGEYVEFVINELLLVLSDSLRDYLADEDPGGARAEAVIRDVYGSPLLETRLDELLTVFGTDEGRATQLPPEDFGVQRFEFVEIAEVGEDCVAVYGFYDLTETSRFPYDDTPAAIVIKRDETFRSEINQTAWRLWDASLLLRDDEPYPIDELSQADNLHEIVDSECLGG